MPVPSQSSVDAAQAIPISQAEREKGAYSPFTLQKALEAIHQDGFVVLKSVVDLQHVDALNSVMSAYTDTLLNERHAKAKHYNHGVKSNILQGPPVTAPDNLYDDVYFNPFVIQVMNAYLGSTPIWNFLTGNTALRKTDGIRQPVHKDVRFHHPQCPFYVIANCPLSDFRSSNGSTEFWLGSHAHTTGDDQIPATAEAAVGKQRQGDPSCPVRPEVVEARRQIRPPVQVVADRGDFMLRDLRTWHAGMPNGSDSHRLMIALGYQAPWYPNYSLRTTLPLSQANFFLAHADQPVQVMTNLVSDEEVELSQHRDNFDFRPSLTQDQQL